MPIAVGVETAQTNLQVCPRVGLLAILCSTNCARVYHDEDGTLNTMLAEAHSEFRGISVVESRLEGF